MSKPIVLNGVELLDIEGKMLKMFISNALADATNAYMEDTSDGALNIAVVVLSRIDRICRHVDNE